jgi:Uma2 family endonuclease
MKAATTKEVYYPESDGKPMAETDWHRDFMVTYIERLKARYRGRRVYVSGNNFIYYVEGDPKKSVSPDLYVVKNCSPGRRRLFKIWEEGRVPCFAMETTSRKTKREDSGAKKVLFAQIGIKEYFLFDPDEDWLHPPLQGFRLDEHGEYQPIPPAPDGSVISKELGIRFIVEDDELAMFDVKTGERILSDAERTQQAEQHAAQAEQHAAQAQRQAEEEKRRNDALQEELQRLRRQIGQQGKNGGSKPSA